MWDSFAEKALGMKASDRRQQLAYVPLISCLTAPWAKCALAPSFNTRLHASTSNCCCYCIVPARSDSVSRRPWSRFPWYRPGCRQSGGDNEKQTTTRTRLLTVGQKYHIVRRRQQLRQQPRMRLQRLRWHHSRSKTTREALWQCTRYFFSLAPRQSRQSDCAGAVRVDAIQS